ncbi:bifunctional diguanylate cyclase/phosphodiesterase [Rhodobacteraceae bacterium RKSG542]|uniref:putative bifunctional diguanylate cyclase/phosphodiesterase n=1 Tax=Pseudovibrio flavus TaxID=2529854 RepID=UPI0012BC04D6|nr:bifunctional diguanylate cyclase/phosphodiesterase [Pseudovibrio flavus]MTI17681.1 bifunctional diguanylate cyclase/phosphodiesterase [Pseudovibrio flavus]
MARTIRPFLNWSFSVLLAGSLFGSPELSASPVFADTLSNSEKLVAMPKASPPLEVRLPKQAERVASELQGRLDRFEENVEQLAARRDLGIANWFGSNERVHRILRSASAQHELGEVFILDEAGDLEVSSLPTVGLQEIEPWLEQLVDDPRAFELGEAFFLSADNAPPNAAGLEAGALYQMMVTPLGGAVGFENGSMVALLPVQSASLTKILNGGASGVLGALYHPSGQLVAASPSPTSASGATPPRHLVLKDGALHYCHVGATSLVVCAAVKLGAIREVGAQVGQTEYITPTPAKGEEVTIAIAIVLLLIALGFYLWQVWQRRKTLIADDTAPTRTDRVTGLPNRTRFLDELAARLKRRQSFGRPSGIFIMSLDEFKLINDSLGYDIGNELLAEVAGLMRNALPSSFYLARLDGGSFAMIAPPNLDADALGDFALMLLSLFDEPVPIRKKRLIISASFGVAPVANDIRSASILMRQADLALSDARNDGRNTLRFFHEALAHQAAYRQSLINDLPNALRNNELSVHYQPQVDLVTRRIIGFEALMRWEHDERGFIPPVEFIPVAEEIGLMGELGVWILKEACRNALDWPEDVRVAVNVSPKQLRTGELEDALIEIIEETGLAAERIDLEITESAVLEENDEVHMRLHNLKDLGVQISMDDFGTGYSSLSSLRRVPFDNLKIDRRFISTMFEDEEAISIVTAIIELARRLGLVPVAEGIEDEHTAIVLEQMGCKVGQGYYFGKPAYGRKALSMLAGQNPATSSVRKFG